MAIVVRLDVMLALRKMRSKEFARKIDLTEANLSLLKSGKVKGIRFATLEAICAELRLPARRLARICAERRGAVLTTVTDRRLPQPRSRHWSDR